MVRGRELRKGILLWCCCWGLCTGSTAVVKHLAQLNRVLGMGVGEMNLACAGIVMVVPPAPASNLRDCEDNVRPEARICVWNVRGTGAMLAQIPNSAGHMSCQRIRSVTEVMCILSVIKGSATQPEKWQGYTFSSVVNLFILLFKMVLGTLPQQTNSPLPGCWVTLTKVWGAAQPLKGNVRALLLLLLPCYALSLQHADSIDSLASWWAVLALLILAQTHGISFIFCFFSFSSKNGCSSNNSLQSKPALQPRWEARLAFVSLNCFESFAWKMLCGKSNIFSLLMYSMQYPPY